jgi:hypothetical protein
MRTTRAGLAIAGALVVACSGPAYDHYTWNEPYGPSGEPGVPNEPLPPKGPQPSFGPTRHLANAPPPISGGTLAILSDGRVAAADPDRDLVYIVDVGNSGTVTTIKLDPHDEPGRIVQDAAQRVHVVLRSGHGVATIDPAAGKLLTRRPTCAAPRGIAVDGSRLLVACEGGELVALPADPNGTASLVSTIDRDLRDVVVTKQTIYVSRFRTAEVLELSTDGVVIARQRAAGANFDLNGADATLAWRMIAAPPGDSSDRPVVVHQMSTRQMVEPAPGGYGGGGFGAQDPLFCSPGIVSTVVGRGVPLGPLVPAPSQAALPVDVAVDGTDYVIVAAGNGHTQELPQLFVLDQQDVGCGAPQSRSVHGQATAVAVLARGSYVVQSREPAQLELVPSGRIITLSNDSREDTGHAIFHSNSGIGIACASCHGEGRDDAHVWSFDQLGERRTPSLLGTLEGTAPYHWKGDMKDIGQLVDEVMTGRMNGPSLVDDQKSTLQGWLFALPAPSASTSLDAASVARGRALFESPGVGCTRCHAGPRYTTSATVDVGTGGSFQVPSLVGVSARAPYLHDGCAATLLERFGSCGGSKHGDTSKLSATELDDLVNFLGTL